MLSSISFTIGTIIGLMLLPVILFGGINTAYGITLFTMIFTRVSFVNIGNESILVNQVLTLLLIVRFYFSAARTRFRIPKTLLLFTIYSGISISFAVFSTNEVVLGVDGKYQNVAFSFQQFTQYAYLLFAVIFMIFTSNLLEAKKITVDSIMKTLDYSYFAVIFLGFLQIWVSIDGFNYFFKNALIGFGRQSINGMYRIDSTFGEPSMLMLFLTPVFCMHVYRLLFVRFSMKSFFAVLLGMLIAFENQSSSFVVGVAGVVILFLLGNLKGTIKINTSNLWRLLFLGIIILFILLFFHEQIANMFETLFIKLREQNVSGRARSEAVRVHFNVFLRHIAFGVGFGTLRSTDLLTGWLAQLGIIGFGIYSYAIIEVSILLSRQNTVQGKEVFILLTTYHVIMMASVPEFCFVYPWVFYAMGYKVLHVDRANKLSKRYETDNRNCFGEYAV